MIFRFMAWWGWLMCGTVVWILASLTYSAKSLARRILAWFAVLLAMLGFVVGLIDLSFIFLRALGFTSFR